MKTNKRAYNISIKTSKSLEEIQSVVSDQVEFEHSKKITSSGNTKDLEENLTEAELNYKSREGKDFVFALSLT